MQAADAADEVDALVGAGIADAQHRGEQIGLQDGHVQPGHGVAAVGAVLGGQQVPFAAQIHAEAVLLRRTAGPFAVPGGDDEFFVHLAHKGGHAEAVQVLDHAVVIHDIKLLIREEHGEEVVEFLVAAVIRVQLPPFQAHPHGGGCAMVSVCDIGAAGGGKFALQQLDVVLIADDPHRLPHAVRVEVVKGRGGHDLFHHGVYGRPAAVGEENGSGLGVAGIHVTAAVFFLVRPGQLVFFDHVVQIVVHGRAGHDAGLGPAVHDLAVHVQAVLILLQIDAVGDHAPQVGGGGLVDYLVVEPGAQRQVDLCLVHVQEGIGIALRHFAGFLGVHDVIGQCGDFGH